MKDAGTLALEAIRAFQAVDDFSGWHPKYRDAIELAEEALRVSGLKGLVPERSEEPSDSEPEGERP